MLSVWRRAGPTGQPVSVAAIVLTGASAGIGAAASVMLTAQGHEVLATGRSAEKLAAVHLHMLDMAPDGLVVPEPIVADLAAMTDVVALAAQVLDRCDRIDVLANNAGLTTGSRQLSPDGFELTFAVNHLAPFLLTKLLIGRLGTSDGRVVTTSSAVHRVGRLDLDDLQIEHGWRRMRSYGSSKLANILFTTELRRRTGLPATCFHPGGVDTDLSRDSPFTRVFKRFGRFMRTPEQGADTLVWLAVSGEGADPSAAYYADRRPARTSAAATDDALAARLWERSEELVAPFVPAG